jgi:hypothetical protein
LAQVWDSERYRSLGNVRAVDFVRERLGLKRGKARWLAKLGRGVRAVPELDAALSRGQLSPSQVVELLRVIGPGTSAEERRAWTGRAAGLTVRALRAVIQAEVEERKLSSGRQDTSLAPDSGDGSTHTVSISNLQGGLRGGLHPGLNILDPQAPDDGDWLSVAVPARLGEIWSMSIDLARKVAGHHAPHHQCAEWIAADYLAGVGDEDPEETKRHEEVYRRERCAAVLGRLMEGRRARTSIFDEMASGVTTSVLSAPTSGSCDAGSRAAHWPDLSWSQPPLALGALERVDDAADAWQLSAILEQLTARKRRLRLALGEHLERLRQTRSWEELGFASFDEYCDERLGFGRRRAESLIRFDKLLRRYKRIRRAYLRGALSYTAAQKLLGVVHRSTERLWVEWAIGLSCRDIDRTVEYAAIFMLPGADPGVLRRYAHQLGAQSGGIVGMNGAGLGSTHGGASRSASIAHTFAPQSRADGAPGNGNRAAQTFAPLSRADGAPGNGNRAAHTFAPLSRADGPLGNGNRTALGWPLPPTSIRGKPRIAGLEHAISDQPERLVARIRFFAPSESLQVVRRAIRRCRQVLEQPGDPYRPDWCFLEVILVQFILEHDTPRTRRFLREHAILARDNFCCAIPDCTSRSQLESHHIWMQSDQGPDDAWNQVSLCKGHHDLVHAGVIELGGWAPWALYVRQGINPRTNRALVRYKNGRIASEHEVREALAHWRSWCRRRWDAAQRTRRRAERGERRRDRCQSA